MNGHNLGNIEVLRKLGGQPLSNGLTGQTLLPANINRIALTISSNDGATAIDVFASDSIGTPINQILTIAAARQPYTMRIQDFGQLVTGALIISPQGITEFANICECFLTEPCE